MRDVLHADQFTPFGLWIRQYLKSSKDGISVTNLDYVVEDFKRKKILLLEEKQSGGILHRAQALTFKVLDQCLAASSTQWNYDYWGFFVLQFPSLTTMPGPGMTLNSRLITCEELQAHLNFEQKFCPGKILDFSGGTPVSPSASLFGAPTYPLDVGKRAWKQMSYEDRKTFAAWTREIRSQEEAAA